MQCWDKCNFEYLVSKRLFVALPDSLLFFHFAQKIANTEFGFLRSCCFCSQGHRPGKVFLCDSVWSELYRSIYSRIDCFNKRIQFLLSISRLYIASLSTYATSADQISFMASTTTLGFGNLRRRERYLLKDGFVSRYNLIFFIDNLVKFCNLF